jgi:hypothetical protein
MSDVRDQPKAIDIRGLFWAESVAQREPRLKEKGNPMPRKKRARRKNITDGQRVADAKKALKQTERVLNAELKKIKGYVRSLDGHDVFNI